MLGFGLVTIALLLASANYVTYALINTVSHRYRLAGSSSGILYSSSSISGSRSRNKATISINANRGSEIEGEEGIILEVFTSKTYERNQNDLDRLTYRSTRTANPIDTEADFVVDVVAFDSVYDDEKEDKVSVVLDSPFSRVINVAFNPIALVVSLYVFILASNKISDFFSSILAAVGLRKKDELLPSEKEKKKKEELEAMPFQVFECEKCQMQMRPAKGRADKIFGRERFRCSRCGAKASSYFNVDDMDDPRAVARLERLEQEAEEESYLEDDDDYDNDEDEDSE